MLIQLNYGRGTLPLELPAGVDADVIRKPAMPVYENPPEALRAALAQPVGARPLAEEARGRRSACILICDVTRPAPNGLMLSQVIGQLREGGMEPSQILVLVATGLHRPNLGAELEELVGDAWVMQNVRVENHDARDDALHVDYGHTPGGTPVKIDRRFAEADLRIVTGVVEPHFMAGYSGGRKVIAPGAAHRDTITTFHSTRFMEHPRADNGVLEGNPLHREQLAIVKMIGSVFAVNPVIDEHRRLSFINAGEIVESHLEAVRFIERYAFVPVPRRYRTVVTSAAGHPLDRNYYQTVKGMVAPLDILEPGGNLLIVSDCSEGLGSREYRDAQERLLKLGMDGFLEDIERKRFADIDEWQTEMQLKPMRRAAHIRLFTNALDEDERALTGIELVESIERAVAESVRETGDARIAVIPEGPYVVPVYRAA